MLGSISIPARLDNLVFWEPFSWLTSVGTSRNTVIRRGWSRIGLAVLILHAAGVVGLRVRPAVISGRYNKCQLPQLQNHYAHFLPLQHTHIHGNTTMRNWSWGMIMGFEALYAGCGRKNPVWSGKEAHGSLRGWIVKLAEHCGADYKPLVRLKWIDFRHGWAIFGSWVTTNTQKGDLSRAPCHLKVFWAFFLNVLRYELEILYTHPVGGTTHQVWVSSQSGLCLWRVFQTF